MRVIDICVSEPDMQRHSTITGDPGDALTYARHYRPAERTAEQRLQAAVLEQALDDLVAARVLAFSPAPAARRTRCRVEANPVLLYWSTRRWVLDDDTLHPFSFVAICESLGLEPEAVRRRVLSGCVTSRPRPGRVTPRFVVGGGNAP